MDEYLRERIKYVTKNVEALWNCMSLVKDLKLVNAEDIESRDKVIEYIMNVCTDLIDKEELESCNK